MNTDIAGFEGLYKIYSDGRIWSYPKPKSRGNNFIGSNVKNNYTKVALVRGGEVKRCDMHRLVAEHFIANPHKKPHVNHIDGNKHNNHVSNLEWVTPSENTLHAFNTGLCTRDHRINDVVRTISMNTAREIRRVRKEDGSTYKELSLQFEVSIDTVGDIVRCETYKEKWETTNNDESQEV